MKRIICIILILFMTISINCPIYALSLTDTDSNTSVSGWCYINSQKPHMGTKSSKYTYDSPATMNNYSSYVNGGIALWGNNIGLTYTAQSNAPGIFTESQEASTATASTTISASGTYCHIYSYYVKIYSVNFDSKTTAGKYRTIAHEVGHVYGLGDLSGFTSQIMYDTYSATKNVTSNDIWGMRFVSHQHVHSSSTVGNYTQYNSTYHKVTCSNCKGIYKQNHSFSSGVCTKCGYTQ